MSKAAVLRRENARFGRRFVDIDVTGTTATRALRNRDWLIQFFDDNGIIRLSICRAKLDPTGTRWADGITWDELQWLKAEAGFADSWAVEVFPPDDQVVNVANMRHLWVLPGAPDYGWGRS